MSAVAERYAQAIFELGDAEGRLRPLADGFSTLGAAFRANPQLVHTLANPTLSSEQQRDILTTLAQKVGLPDVGRRALLLMAERHRLFAVAEVAERLATLADDKEGVLEAYVTTAEKLPDSFYQQLTRQLEKTTGKRIRLQRSTEADLIGGAIVQVGDATIDASIRGRLASLERELTTALST